MTAPSRFLAWLVLPLFALCSSNLLADTVEGAPQALHLLDYIGADYAETVQAGNVINESEYRQQLDSIRALQGLIAAMPDKPEKAALEQGVSTLRSAVAAHQDSAEVARQARQLGAKLAVAYEVSQAPIITPDPTRGAPLYAQHCSVCHGDAGAGDGPAGVGLTPPPSNLRDTARLDHLSLYALYSTLGLGVEGTDMPAFADQLDDRQRWDLATYIASFSADPAAAKAEKTYNIDLPCPARATAAGQARPGATARLHRGNPGQERRGLPRRRARSGL
jgi:high-affinity iron transporter